MSNAYFKSYFQLKSFLLKIDEKVNHGSKINTINNKYHQILVTRLRSIYLVSGKAKLFKLIKLIFHTNCSPLSCRRLIPLI